MILSQAFNQAATKAGSKAAFHYLGKDIPFSEAKARVARLSYLFLNELKPKQRVAFITTNSPSVTLAFLALTNTRSVSIFINPDLTPDDIVKTLKDTKAGHIFVTSDLAQKVKDILREAHLQLPVIEFERKQGGEYDPTFSPPQDNVPNENDAVLILRTAGSTSAGAKYTIFNHQQVQQAATALKFTYRLLPTERIYTQLNWALPFSFVHGMLFPLLSGVTCVVDYGLQNLELLEFIVKARITRMVGTPAFFLKLLLLMKEAQQATLPGMKSITVGMGLLTPMVQKTFELIKVPVAPCYGQTEALWSIAMADTKVEEGDSKTGGKSRDHHFIGRGLPGFKYKVIDINGDEITGSGPREGALCVMGPTVMTSYQEKDLEKKPETKQKIRGTWLYTFDCVRLEGEGDTLQITWLGRQDELIRDTARIRSPEPIDGALRGIPGVADGAGFVMSTQRGQLVFGAAVVKEAPNVALNEAAVIEAIKPKLRVEEMPSIVVFVDQIPKDVGGNINRTRMRQQFSGLVG